MTAEPFPLDDETIALLAVAGETGTMTGTLDLLSGYDPSTLTDVDGIDVPPAGWKRWDRDHVIAALIAEVRRLRSSKHAPVVDGPSAPASTSPAPTPHPYRPVALSAATGALLGAAAGWLLAGRRG